MKLKSLGFAILAVSASMALAGNASATTLELGGVSQNQSVTIKASLLAGSSTLWVDTGGFFANTCTGSTIELKTGSPFTAATVGGAVSALSFSPCTLEKVIVDSAGSLSIEWIAGTTNGTVRWTGTKVTVPSHFPGLTCVTAASPGTDVGMLTGVKTGNATMHINAVLNCGASSSVRWTATYRITSPEGLGVAS